MHIFYMLLILIGDANYSLELIKISSFPRQVSIFTVINRLKMCVYKKRMLNFHARLKDYPKSIEIKI